MKRSANLIAYALQAACALLLALAGGVASAQSANSIEAIDVTSQSGGRTLVKVTLKDAPANPPAGFAVSNPPRIAFDFPNTTNASGTNVRDIKEGDVRKINLVQAAGRTRMVLELAKNVSYDTRIDGRALLITLQGAAAASAGAATISQQFSQPQPGEQQHSLRDIDFRRGSNGEGRLIVDLSDSTVGIDVKQQGGQVVIDFLNTALPKNLERRLDVVDFGTPVQTVDAFTQRGGARIVIASTGSWEQSAYQTDNRFIVEVKRVVEDPNRLTRRGFTGEKLSLNFQNVEVRAVLQVIADFTGLNIITSDTVTGNLTLRLKDVPWDQALDIILQSKGLDMRKTGNVVWIAPRDELATKEKLALEAQQQIADLEPLRTESFQLNYAKASVFQAMLVQTTGGIGGTAQRILSRRGSATVDARTNTVFVRDTAARLDEVRKLVAQIDKPVRQVMIESRIVEANDTFSRNLGVRLGYSDFSDNAAAVGTKNSGIRLRPGATSNAAGNGVSPDSLQFGNNVELPAGNISGTPAGVLSFILFNQAKTRFLNLELSALQADGRGKIISNPRVITADQVEATIEQGTEIPYQEKTSSGATSVSFKKATLSLKVKPQVTPSDNVIMALDIHKDSVGQDTGAGVPAIDTKQVKTEVLVDNGGTVVIGGIYTQEERSTTNKVPVLGDLPYVGFLFKQNQKTDNRNELLIFITPKILRENLLSRQ